MKIRGTLLVLATLALSLSGGWTYAQDDESELTMRLLPPNAQASAEALREIELPTRIDEATGEPVPIPSEQGQTNGSEGLMRANEARFEGVANGAAAAEAAQTNREEMGRGTMPDLSEILPPQAPEDLPGGPPENPGPPEGSE